MKTLALIPFYLIFTFSLIGTEWHVHNEQCLTQSVNSNCSILLTKDHERWINPEVPIEQFFGCIELIGKGSHSQIYQATYHKTGEICVLKEYAYSPEIFQAMRKEGALSYFEPIAKHYWDLLNGEFSIGILLDHPVCLKVHHLVAKRSVRDDKLHVYLITEKLNEASTTRERQSSSLLLQLAEGMSHIFEKNILPDDLGSWNTLITKDGSIVLIDYGHYKTDWDDSIKDELNALSAEEFEEESQMYTFKYFFEKNLLYLFNTYADAEDKAFLTAKKEEISKKPFYNDIYQNEHYPVLKKFVQEVLDYLRTKSL